MYSSDDVSSNYNMEFNSLELNRKYIIFRTRSNEKKYAVVILFAVLATAFVIICQSEPIFSNKWGDLYTVTSYCEIVVLILLWIESASRLRLIDGSVSIFGYTLSNWIAALYIVASPITNGLMLLSRALNKECPIDLIYTQSLYCNTEQKVPATNILANCSSCLVNSIIFYGGWRYTILSYIITYVFIITTYVKLGSDEYLVFLLIAISFILTPFIYVGHTLERQSLDLFKEAIKNKNGVADGINTYSLTTEHIDYEYDSNSVASSNSTIVLEDIVSR